MFLDPPFDSDLLTAAAGLLDRGSWLAPGALIYVECAARKGLPPGTRLDDKYELEKMIGLWEAGTTIDQLKDRDFVKNMVAEGKL